MLPLASDRVAFARSLCAPIGACGADVTVSVSTVMFFEPDSLPVLDFVGTRVVNDERVGSAPGLGAVADL